MLTHNVVLKIGGVCVEVTTKIYTDKFCSENVM